MSTPIAGQDGRIQSGSRSTALSRGGWIVSCILHAACLLWLYTQAEPARHGPPGESGGTLLEARFLRGGPARKKPLDTALPDEIVQIAAVIPAREPHVKNRLEEAPADDDVPAPKRPRRRSVPGSAWQSSPSKKDSPNETEQERHDATDGERHTDSVISRTGSGPVESAGSRDLGHDAHAVSPPRSGAGTTFFGTRGAGKKFVYVIDCSGSMSDRSLLAAARAELMSSLEQLPASALVQVLFYNDQPHPAIAPDREPALVRNTRSERRRIRQFSLGVIAGGGTNHIAALELALRLNPDAIFWLTDADEPHLTRTELGELRAGNRRRVPIHAVEFGHGPLLVADNFLMRVARATRGEYQYCDVDSHTLDGNRAKGIGRN